MRSLSLVLVGLFALGAVAAASVERRSVLDADGNGGEMNDALRYLEELDKYYSQVARPRERRVGQNVASALEKLSQIKNYYNEAGRPRFGKRAGHVNPIDVPAMFPGFERWWR